MPRPHSSAPASPSLPPPPPQAATGFGPAHAAVIIAFLLTAALLAVLHMPVADVLWLIGGAGAIGSSVVLLTVTGGAGRFGAALRALLGPEK
ncbi:MULTISPECIES: hypothetical protein [Streptomyces]|uniref:Uncharacterized protein n=1 Tax=Streptomyces spororaveus TaxID=284039 RepID=A0ABQ3T354_9ACTN|nr:hypothetical protein [Streptomyces spororaveus]GHI74823.1 hypothetical protein Sspor_03840 [Streptomyces spororaveus]